MIKNQDSPKVKKNLRQHWDYIAVTGAVLFVIFIFIGILLTRDYVVFNRPTNVFASRDSRAQGREILPSQVTQTRGSAGRVINDFEPIISDLTVSQPIDSSHNVVVSVFVYDQNIDNVQLQFSFKLTNDDQCLTSAGSINGTIARGLTASFGQESIIIDNENFFQLQNIITSSGRNQVSFIWQISSDIPRQEGEVCVFVTPSDGSRTGRFLSRSLIIDNVSPTKLGPLMAEEISYQSARLRFGGRAEDSHFDEYNFELSSKNELGETVMQFMSSTSLPFLGFSDYQGVSSTLLTSLTTSTLYTGTISARDTYGNSTSTAPLIFSTLADIPGPPSLTELSTSSVNLVLNRATNPSSTQYAVCVVTKGNNCQGQSFLGIDGSIFASTTWQTLAQWGDISGVKVIGLTERSPYQLLVKARNALGFETPLSMAAIFSPPAPSTKVTAEFMPSSILQIIKAGLPTMYTNNLSITLKLDPTFAKSVVLQETEGLPLFELTKNDFQVVKSTLPWRLSAGDGKKCLTAFFRDEQIGFESITFVCVILDTVPPPLPMVEVVKLTRDEQINFTQAIVTGQAEPLSTITLSTRRNSLSRGTPISRLVNFLPNFLFSLLDDTVYTTEADEQGSWSFIFPEWFSDGTYTLVVSATDKAGNVSTSVEQLLSIQSSTQISDSSATVSTTTDNVSSTNTSNTNSLEPQIVTSGGGGSTLLPEPEELITTQFENATATVDIVEQSDQLVTEQIVTSTDVDNLTANELIVIDSLPIVILSSLPEVIQDISIAALEIIEDETVETINESIAAPTVAAAAAANVAVGFGLPQLLVFLRYLFAQPLVLMRLRKQKSWGVVYHAFTKRPIDLAVVRLIDEKTKAVVQTVVTDFQGRYVFIASPGQYRLEVTKPNFVGISNHLQGREEDAKYIHLYHGEVINVSEVNSTIQHNIPLDPIGEDRPTMLVIREHSAKIIQRTLSVLGIGLATISFVISPTPLMAIFLAFHLFFYGIFYRLAFSFLPSSYGTVRAQENEKPLLGVVVRVFDKTYDKLVDTKVTDRKGRYAALVGPSLYYVTYEKPLFQKKKSPILDYSNATTKGRGGIIHRDEVLKRSRKAASLES